MKRFTLQAINQNLVKAKEIAESLLTANSKMMTDLAYKSDWAYPPIYSGQALVNLLIQEREPVAITTYRPWYWRSPVIAYHQSGVIHFNDRKFYQLDHISMTGTLLHEYAHYCGLSHGNNYKTNHKVQFSVPYYISENIKLWIA